ncbi:hypothetical protein ALQ03_103088 [Pseudomonas savastanoi pv. glycinea]|uniref:Uncharacterized protein n=2 Tax=Pseudomonas savastanoi pv. glycinea TaxID=318 RepID=E7PI56_PSESG|nr:hypothetical protein PsgB076_24229 [Pseudomonas savastanoi pv. glycinea str. B076]EFW86913.1 hypothetical protein PsgRace4_06203 [Pseudomonas savastanoi pv. glycinea str. race 4]RML41116.1 hypothetical protein ALQ97_103168 [Pseudomonas savastanoi pv. glycinea]EGH06317.1 hypothetical protein Pgy4_01310 [Pseudomonas savastanoi pv. glycinea str. race 4]RML91608.1 hypothetical protein ALQ87_102873 [Pseudomonas savastanoi pv. glycinea]
MLTLLHQKGSLIMMLSQGLRPMLQMRLFITEH